jgi:hypothetical protein
MVDEALKVMKTIAALKVSGDDKGVEALLDTLEKRTIHAAAKKAKEWEKSQSQLPANPAGVTADAILDIGDADNDAVGDVGSSPLTKGDVITRLDRDLRRYLENLELGQLLEFENDLATFKESWRQGHPSQNDKADCGAGGVAK